MSGFSPKSARETIEILTGIFEGGSYCTLADNPADAQGGLSYGKHQASELQGCLTEVLKLYIGRTEPPLPEPASAAAVQKHLAYYDPSWRKYRGTPAQRVVYKQLLKSICNQPAMHSTQDQFFHQMYFAPAAQHASTYGISTPLGQSIFYDIAIQAGAGRQSFYRAALAQWTAANPGKACTACECKDANGPDEPTFLRFVNAARRAEMLGSSSPAYRASVYRPNEFDKLLESGNLEFKRDFVFRGVPIKGLP